ncbi:hypothetical protein GWK47_051735 [Chionoecetes opilio]|uniref:Uncharacterized protein n=1 Tax=Chionoecetes opilio TaxID=41210 RepID=A0A8J4Y8R5_CHIOP|nr:hypothetical protein GWK47_051735 [Chionoecetes opilio]
MHSGTKSCHDQFNTQKLARRRSEGEIALPAPEDRCRRPRKCFDKTSCIFCTKEDGLLHEFKTLGADDNVRSMARDLFGFRFVDTGLKVSVTHCTGGQVPSCLLGWTAESSPVPDRNRENLQDASKPDKKARARAFAELVTYIENEVEEGTLLFKFASLRHLYESRLADFGIRSEVKQSSL